MLRLTRDFKTLRLTPARHQPDMTFQNHASDVIFCDHASDVQYESGYVPLARDVGGGRTLESKIYVEV